MSNTINDGGPAFPAGNMDEQVPSNGMTLRQYAAIKLRVPDSGVEWLDKMIETSLRNDLAAKALQGLLADPSIAGSIDEFACKSYVMADAIMFRALPIKEVK